MVKENKKINDKKEEEEENEEEEEPNFSDDETFVDKISDQELLGELLKKKPKESDSFDNVIVVDNLPQVGPDRLEKLQNIVKKIYSKFGVIVNSFYPEKDNTLKGFIFLEYQTKQEAIKAVKGTDGYKLDKNHTLTVNIFSDIDRYTNIPVKWQEPTPVPYKDHGNLYSWLMNKNCYDQFNVIWEGGETISWYLNTPSEPLCLDTRKCWSESFIKWSPKGTYLLTYHKRGVALWGGEQMNQLMKFQHPQAQLSDFSPCEKYLVTFSPLLDNSEDGHSIIIWDVKTGYKKRSFQAPIDLTWPLFKWSHNGKYFARMSQDTLSIFETPSFGLLDKKSLKIKDLKDFSWSPVENILSYWLNNESGDNRCRVVLIDVPSLDTLCTKNLLAVADCRMHWQKLGLYLCIKVDRYKSKKEDKDQIKYAGLTHSFVIFRIKEKDVPIETIEIKDSITAFAWEPNGFKFAYVHGEAPRINVSFCEVKPHGVAKHIKTFEKKSVNHLFWNPNGQFIVLAGLRNMNGVLEFVDTNDMSIMNQAEHFMATDVEWDPTGRYVVTGVSWWVYKVDNAFWLWNFQGKLLSKHPVDRFCQLLWRPKPPCLLSSEQIRDIKKNVKNYSQKFSIEDKKRESKASKEQIERRGRLLALFKEEEERYEKNYMEEKPIRLKLRKNIDTDELDSHVENFAEERVEFLVDVEEIIVE